MNSVVIDIQVIIDEAWATSTSPYRVVTNGMVYRPMTKQEVEDQISSMVYRALWDD